MPLKRPVAGDPVVVEDFGQPVYDAIVRCGATRTGVQTPIPDAGTYHLLTWTTTVEDTGGVVTSTSLMTVPANKGGLWIATYRIQSSQTNANTYVSITMAGSRYDFLSTNNGFWCGTTAQVMAPGETCQFNMWNGNGTSLPIVSSKCSFYRMSI